MAQDICELFWLKTILENLRLNGMTYETLL